MDKKQEKVQVKAKKQTGKIVGIIIAAVIVVIAAIFLVLNLTKPSAKDALNTAANTKITSARSTITVTENKKGNKKKQSVTMLYEFDKKYNHIRSTYTPKSAGDAQELWSSSKRVYNKDGKDKWQYMDRTSFTASIFDEMFSGYKKLFTAHHFNRFSQAGLNQLKVGLDGLGGYTLSYKGDNKDVLKSIQKAATISGSSESTDVSEIKNIDLMIKVNRKKELREMLYTVNYKNNKGTVSVHLYDVNGVNNLSLPAATKKATAATE